MSAIGNILPNVIQRLKQIRNKRTTHKTFFATALAAFFSFQGFIGLSQDSLQKLTFSGYAEVYYSYDSDQPNNHEKAGFLYNHKRHNEVNINLAYLKAAYTDSMVRANVALMAGNYAQYNLAAEPSLLQMIYQADVGIRLSRKKNIYLDAGVMPSHIGFESAVAADCWTPSRSLMAENSPYFETGAKLTATNQRSTFFVSALVLNGWQRIYRLPANNKPSFGLQLNYKPGARLTLNYSNFIGSDKPDSVNAIRTFHNMYFIFEASKKFGIIGCFDIGTDKTAGGQYDYWFTPALLLRLQTGEHSRLGLRGEYFGDKNQLLISTGTKHGFQTSGVSLNYDYFITPSAMFRMEAKWYNANDPLFKEGKDFNNYSGLATVSIKF